MIERDYSKYLLQAVCTFSVFWFK